MHVSSQKGMGAENGEKDANEQHLNYTKFLLDAASLSNF